MVYALRMTYVTPRPPNSVVTCPRAWLVLKHFHHFLQEVLPHRVREARDREARRGGTEVSGEAVGVDGGGHEDHAQVGAAR